MWSNSSFRENQWNFASKLDCLWIRRSAYRKAVSSICELQRSGNKSDASNETNLVHIFRMPNNNNNKSNDVSAMRTWMVLLKALCINLLLIFLSSSTSAAAARERIKQSRWERSQEIFLRFLVLSFQKWDTHTHTYGNALFVWAGELILSSN